MAGNGSLEDRATLLSVRGVGVRFGGIVALDSVSFDVPRGVVCGLIGPNGAGKTTLFRMLVGQEKPDSGVIKVGATVDIGFVDQNRDALDPNKTVFEEILDQFDTEEGEGWLVREVEPDAAGASTGGFRAAAKEMAE
jgi:ATPase subunit of ABC transporter with duplicated ATPase domains